MPKTDAVILNSVTNLPKAKEFIASHNRVITYLDNDETGRKATAELRTMCKNLSDQSKRYSRHNDLNAYLQNHPVKKEPERPVNRRCGARAEQAGLPSPSREEEKPAGLKGKKRGRSM
ncbi:MAG: toprim domain-containing protein [Rikenellaceae bacterium]|nr:toprim domain-containing protein [Rikenellaceae bacterium]